MSTYIITQIAFCLFLGNSYEFVSMYMLEKKEILSLIFSPISQGCDFSFLPPFSPLRDSNKIRLVATVKKKLIERKT